MTSFINVLEKGAAGSRLIVILVDTLFLLQDE